MLAGAQLLCLGSFGLVCFLFFDVFLLSNCTCIVGDSSIFYNNKCGFPLVEEQKKRKCFSHTVGSEYRCVKGFRSHGLGPVHTYPDVFESATFSFRIRKYPRPHVM